MDASGVAIREKVPASRKLGRAEAEELASAAKRVIIARGKKVEVFEPKGAPDDALLTAMLGSTGNLRAPTVRVGTTLLVGFNEDEYRKTLG